MANSLVLRRSFWAPGAALPMRWEEELAAAVLGSQVGDSGTEAIAYGADKPTLSTIHSWPARSLTPMPPRSNISVGTCSRASFFWAKPRWGSGRAATGVPVAGRRLVRMH